MWLLGPADREGLLDCEMPPPKEEEGSGIGVLSPNSVWASLMKDKTTLSSSVALLHDLYYNVLQYQSIVAKNEDKMRYRSSYAIFFLAAPRELHLPLRIEHEGKTFVIQTLEDDNKHATALIEGPVNRENLTLKVGRKPIDGSAPAKGILVPEDAAFAQFATTVTHFLTFLLDIPIRHSRRHNDELIAEDDLDEVHLNDLGTKDVYTETSAIPSLRTFHALELSGSAYDALVSKDVGMALYSLALLLQEPIGQFRELWKVLESAFSTKDRRLVQLVAKYAPAKAIGFTHEELNKMLVLRGRASHAESRSGMSEYRDAAWETARRLPRLKCLVEQVLLTKKAWGKPTLGVERLAPVHGYVDQNGALVLIRHSNYG